VVERPAPLVAGFFFSVLRAEEQEKYLYCCVRLLLAEEFNKLSVAQLDRLGGAPCGQISAKFILVFWTVYIQQGDYSVQFGTNFFAIFSA
jgi:hypothetical protein